MTIPVNYRSDRGVGFRENDDTAVSDSTEFFGQIRRPSRTTALLPVDPGIIYPATRSEFGDLVNFTIEAIYQYNEESGNLLAIHGADLDVAGTPQYGDYVGTRRGILMDSTDDGFSAFANIPGTDNIIYGEVLADMLPQGTTRNMYGWYDATGYVLVRVFSGGLVRLTIYDGTSTFHVIPTGDPPITQGVAYLTQIQLDRDGAFARFRMSGANGQVLSGETDITTLTDISQAQEFFTGRIPGQIPGTNIWKGYGYFARGTECSGADKLAEIAQALRWE